MDPAQDPNQPAANQPDAPDQDTMEKIRLRRLAKLGTSSPKPEDASSSSTPKPSTPPVADQEKKETAEAALKRKINITPVAPAAGDNSHKRTAAKIDDRAQQGTQPATKKVNTSEESFDDWSDRTLTGIFRATVDTERLTDAHGHKLFFMSGVAAEHEEADTPKKFLVGDIDSAILEATSSRPLDFPVLKYLLSCWKRAARGLSQAKELESGKRNVLAEAKRLSMSYCLFSLTMPDFFGRSEPESLVPFLLRGLEHEDCLPMDWIKEATERFEEEEAYANAFANAMMDISTRLSQMNMEQDFRPCLNAMILYTKFPALMKVVAAHDAFLTNGNGPDLESRTILGPFFKLSPLNKQVALTYFPNPRQLDRNRIAQAQDSLRTILRLHQDELFNIANAFIRAGADTRNHMLNWFALCVNLNHKRRAIQVDPREVCSDGFMVNVTTVLDRFCSPFMDTTFSKVGRIEVEYFQRHPRVTIKDETKINADQATSDAFYSGGDDAQANFISEVFFLTLAAHHYGSGATSSKLKDFDREIKYLEKQITAMEAERPKFANLARFELGLKRYTEALEHTIASKNAIEGVFMDEKMQDLSLRFMRYVAVWLLRLASQSDYTPDKELSIPLPSPSPPSFACLPEYALQDVVDNFKFVYRYLPQIMPSAVGNEMIALCVAFLQSSEFIKNPYLKSSLVTLLFSGTWPFMHFKKGVLGDQLYGSKFANDHLLHALLKFYIEAESTGAHTQFYDKFNIRYEIFQVIKCIWGNDVYKQQLTRESKVNRQFFVQFVNLLLNDATYVLDEALTKFPKIHTLQAELDHDTGMSPQDREKKLEELSTLESQAGSYMQLANETLSMMKLFTSALSDAFTMPEIVQRLASMLNYNLETLAGPKMGQLRVNNPQKYHFQPRVLLSDFVEIYLNLGTSTAFIEAVAADGRSYKPETFEKAGYILAKRAMKDEQDLRKFEKLQQKFKVAKQEADQAELDLGEIPDDFEDPILGDLMKDPVILPSKHIVDRSTITQHLLSDPTDPFNRQRMTIDDVVPDDELRARIEAWKTEKVEAAKAKLKGDDAMDTTEG